MVALSHRDKIFALLLFVFSLCIRAGVYYCYLSHDHNYWQVDSQTYHRVAQNIADGKGIINADGTSHFYRLPGYPLFIAFFYKLFGPHPERALWVQIFLASFIPLLIFLLSLTLFPTRLLLARCVGLYGAMHLGLVLYSGFFMTETLFIFFFLLFCLFFFARSERRPWAVRQKISVSSHVLWPLPEPATMSPSVAHFYEKIGDVRTYDAADLIEGDVVFKAMSCAGIFLGLASLVRPVGHYVVVVALLLLLFSSDTWRQKIRKARILGLAWVLPVSFWLIRNFLLTGHLFFHTLPGGHFLYLSAARVAAEVHDCSYQQARDRLHHKVDVMMQHEEKIKERPLHEIERCLQHEKLARHYFISYPCITLKYWLTDMFRTCFSLYSAELLYLDAGRKNIEYFAKDRTVSSWFARYLAPQTGNRLLIVVVYLEIMLFLLTLLGFAVGLLLLCTMPISDRCVWLYLMPLMALFITIALAGGYARMRLPLEPFLMILSGYFWTDWKEKTV